MHYHTCMHFWIPVQKASTPKKKPSNGSKCLEKNSFLLMVCECTPRVSLTTHAINNPASARISVPSILIPQQSTLTPLTRANKSYAFRWRTPLKSTAPYWHCTSHLHFVLRLTYAPSVAWFDSLSTRFLSVRTGRLLVLAGRERLDTTLEIGHMQGKFQLKVMAGRGGAYVGHLVHEVSVAPLGRDERGDAD